MYTIRLLQLSGVSVTELELPPAASISDIVVEYGTLSLLGYYSPSVVPEVLLWFSQQVR